MQAVSDTVIEVQGKKVTVPTTIRVRYPGAFRVDSDMPAGRLTQVFDSGTFWVQDPRGASVAPPGAAESMRGNVQRDSIALLLALADGRVKARRGGDVTIDGRALPVLDVDIKPGGPLVLVFDPATGLILRQRYPWRFHGWRCRRDLLGLPRCRGSQGGVRGDRPPAAG